MPRVLVVNTLDASVVFFDATTRKKLKTVKVGASPQGIALARNGKFGYVTNAGDGTVSVLDIIRMSETARIRPDGIEDPSGIAVLPDGRSLFVVSAAHGHAAVVDAQSGAQRARIELDARPTATTCVNGAGDRVWLADPAAGIVLGVDPKGTVVERIEVAGGPTALAFARDNRTLLVTCRDPARLVRVDTATGRGDDGIAVGPNPVAVAAHPYQDQAFVLAKGGGHVQLVDLQSGTVGRAIHVGLGPLGVAVARAGKVLYVSNAESDSVSVIDVLKAQVKDTWETGHHPGAVAYIS